MLQCKRPYSPFALIKFDLIWSADIWTVPNSFGRKSPVIHIHHCHVLVLLSQQLISLHRPTDGWGLSQPGWLVLCWDHLPVHWQSPIPVISKLGCAEPDKNAGYRFSKKRTELTSKFKNGKLGFRSSVFKNRLRRFGDGFSRLIHNSSSKMIGSIVKVSFFMLYLCTSSSESLRLTISWTNPPRKYVISSIIL